MKIGSISKITEVSRHTIRWYEKIGLLESKKDARDENNYRNYSESDITTLNLIKKIKAHGFTLNDIKDMFGLKKIDQLSCNNIKDIFVNRLEIIEDQIKDLQSKQQKLLLLQQTCTGNCTENFH